MQVCKFCQKHYDVKETKRIFGDMWWAIIYCTAQCYTKSLFTDTMKSSEIIKTLINEIDPNGEVGDNCNVGLAIVVSDKQYKLTLGDLRRSIEKKDIEGESKYRVTSFRCNEMEEVNGELTKRNIDTTDVISITEDRSHDYWYEVFCRELTEEKKWKKL